MLLSLAGFIMCVVSIYYIVLGIIRVNGRQNIFILNVLMNDTVVAIIGTIRGLGIIDKMFVGVRDDETPFCYIYPLTAYSFW